MSNQQRGGDMRAVEHDWTWWSMLAYMLFQLSTGVLGFFEPSIAMSDLNLVGTYSTLMIAFSVLGILGLVWSPKTVMWALYGMSIGTLMHGMTLILFGSVQTGYRLAAAPLMMVPMAYIWWRYRVLRNVLSAPRKGARHES